VIGYVAAMTDDEARAVWTEARTGTAPAMTRDQRQRASLTAKAGHLWDLSQRCRDGNGYTAGMSDAAAALDRPASPEASGSDFSEPAPQTGFQINRAQGASGGSDWAPVRQEDVNSQRISDILNNRRP